MAHANSRLHVVPDIDRLVDGLGPLFATVPVPGATVVSEELAHRLWIVPATGAPRAIGEHGTGPAEFRFPRGLAVVPGATSGATRVFVCDSWNHRIQVLDGDGRLLFAFGTHGSGASQFDEPSDIAVVRPRFPGEPPSVAGPDLLLAVADSGNGRVQVFELDGVFVAAFGTADPPADGVTPGFTREGWPFFRGGSHPYLPLPSRLAWRSPYLDVTCGDGRIARVDLAVALLPDFDRWRHGAPLPSLRVAQSALAGPDASDVAPRVLAQIDTDLGRAWLSRGLTDSVTRLWARPWPAGLDAVAIERQLEERVHVAAVHGAAYAREQGHAAADVRQLLHLLAERIADVRRQRARAVAVRELAWARVVGRVDAGAAAASKASRARAAVGEARGRLVRVTHLAHMAAQAAEHPRTEGHIVWTAMPGRGAVQQATSAGTRTAVVSADGRCLIVIDRLGTPVGEVPLTLAGHPVAAVAHPRGGWLVADAERDALLHVDRSGALVRMWGTRGDDPRQFRGIGGIAATDRVILVCDRDHGRVQVRDLDGDLVGCHRHLNAPVSVAVDGDTLLVAEWRTAQVRRIRRSDGVPIDVFAHPDLVAPTQVVCAPDGVLVADRTAAAVFAFDLDGRWQGTLTAADGLLLGRPTGLAIVDRKHGMVFDGQHGRAVRFALPAKERGGWLR